MLENNNVNGVNSSVKPVNIDVKWSIKTELIPIIDETRIVLKNFLVLKAKNKTNNTAKIKPIINM